MSGLVVLEELLVTRSDVKRVGMLAVLFVWGLRSGRLPLRTGLVWPAGGGFCEAFIDAAVGLFVSSSETLCFIGPFAATAASFMAFGDAAGDFLVRVERLKSPVLPAFRVSFGLLSV